MKEVLVLRDLECIKAIAHPKRIDILKAFNDLPLSAKELSKILDEPHAKINYHVKTLYKVGILELVEEKIKSGIVEKYYYPKSKNIFIDKNIINISLKEESNKVSLSRFDDIIGSLYQSIGVKDLDEENIVDYYNTYLTKDEIIELNNTIKSKISELIHKRESEDDSLLYDIVMVSTPINKKETYNL